MSRALPLALTLLAAHATAAVADEPSYQRHVSAVFSRLGCNGGTCHGAVKGQNGFKLSLFGADPVLDHERLLREYGARRLNLNDPAASLLLLKATAQVSHQGGKRMVVGSFEYEVLRRWIAAGAVADPGPARVQELRVTPATSTVKPGESYRLRVEAKFADGATEDVTPYCSFESRDGQVAEADSAGQVLAKGVGDTALLVRYCAMPALAVVLVPRPTEQAFPDVKPHNFIDTHVLAKLRRLNVPPVGLADDATFLRRVTLDVAGELPTPKEVRDFLEDKTPDKRSKKIEELLTRPGHAALWTLKFCDLLKASDYGVYADALSQEADAPRFQAWVRARLEENAPYDVFVERILTATSRDGKSFDEYADEVQAMMDNYGKGRKDLEAYRQRRSLDLYWQRRGATGVTGTLQVAHAFLGLRLECAQCHRHPHDVWQQDDLLSFANFFVNVRTVGFQGDNEKKYPEMAAVAKRLSEESKKLADQIKMMNESEGKKLDEEAKKAKTDADQLAKEIVQLEKDAVANKEQIEQKKQALTGCKETMAKQEKFRQEVAQMDRRAKLLPEVGKRLLHAEVFMLPAGKAFAKVTSPIGTQTSERFRLLGEAEAVTVPAEQDPRTLVMAWLRRPDNPYFARALVNRVWAHYFGRGIIDPPDNLSPFNPATHPELLKELADGFVQHKYDLRWLHRTILQSRTYQQSGMATKDNAVDRANCAYFMVRRLPAEVLVDALNQATGTTEKMDMAFQHWPEQLKTIEIPFTPRNSFVSFMLENFGKPKRNSAVQCDCERDGSSSIFQVLTLANHPRLWEKIGDANGRVAQLMKEVGDDAERIDEVFLATVGRRPGAMEREACLKYVREAETPAKGLQGVMWSLLNTREFLLQH
jgi:hypothetical protein